MTSTIRVSDSHRFKNYQVQIDGSRYEILKTRIGSATNACCGYGIRVGFVSKIFIALIVSEGKVKLLYDGIVRDVTEPYYTACTRKIGWHKYEFQLKNEDQKALTMVYFDLDPQKSEAPDCHFLVDVCHWLKDIKTRKDYIKYWHDVGGCA